MNEHITLVAPACTCCAEAKALLPRTDLPGQMAVCPQTGTLYRAEGQGLCAERAAGDDGGLSPVAECAG